jgi:lipopolysaccharide assembly outer membrane protein LptD (OstA)
MFYKMKVINVKLYLFIALFISFNVNAKSIYVDSVKVDSIRVDSVSVVDTLNDNSPDAVVIATASDSLTFDVSKKLMYLYGSGEINYKDSELKSGYININFDNNNVFAEGRIDTTKGKNELVETPILKDGGETYEGKSLKYNFKTKRGFISHAKNKMPDVRYEGDKVKKVDDKTFFIEDGIYTTCDSDTPHTHFTAKQMKVIHKDKIVAKWIFMYIAGVPLPIPIPFAVFPSESGRRSGIIIPAYGTTADKGQFFRNFGYFWAISDYMDLALTGDYYTRGGYGLKGRGRYSKRYNYSGMVSGGFSKIHIGEENDPDRVERSDWNIFLYHQQTLDPTMSLNVNMQFLSSTYYQNNSFNTDDLLNQQIFSNATFNKRWDESGNSLTLNYSRTQYLSTGNINEVLPNLSFNKNLVYPFRGDDADDRSLKWYEYIGYQYNGRFLNNRNKLNGVLKIRGGIEHNLEISATPKLGYFNISPRIDYTEKWYNKRISQELVNNQLVTKDVNEINFVRSFDFSLAASTKIYGMMPVNAMGIDAFRHTITPNISYNYSPDFTTDFWGYYSSVIDSTGRIIRYDKFNNEVFRGAGSTERQAISLSLNNVFELKTLKDLTDTTSQAKKFTLLNLSAGLSYNFAADSLKLSDLSLYYRTQIGEFFDFSGNINYTFYENINGRPINKFLLSEGKGLMRLTNFSISLGTDLTPEKIFGKKEIKKKEGTEGEDEEEVFMKQSDYIALYDEQPADFTIPWTLGISLNYNINKRNPTYIYETFGMVMRSSLSISEKWKLTINGNYDFIEKEITAPQITINRDLHCWEMNFSWIPIGRYRGFNFEVRMKAPQLRDIKVTKSKGIYSGLR